MRVCLVLFFSLLLMSCGMRNGEYYPPKNKTCLYLAHDYLLEQGLMGEYLYPAGNYHPAFIDKNGDYYLSRKKVQILLGSYHEGVNYGIYMTNGVPHVFYLDKYSGLPMVKIKESERVVSPPVITNPFPGDFSALLQRREC